LAARSVGKGGGEEEECSFKANAVNEEDSERDRWSRRDPSYCRTVFLRETHPYLPCYPSMLVTWYVLLKHIDVENVHGRDGNPVNPQCFHPWPPSSLPFPFF
jgi:hypothetical protein